MPFTVDDFQDLIRLLGQHPEWRAELRRHVLADELLDLPAVVERIAEQLIALTARVDQIAEQLSALTARVDRLAEAQAAAEERLGRVEERLERIEDRLERIELAIERLIEAQGRTETRVGRLEGEMLELRYARRAPAYFSRLARRLRVMEPEVWADALDEAVQEGRLAEAECAALLDADLVLTGRRREDGAEVYLLAEISAGIGPHDVERAAERAALLEKLGRPVTPIVAGGWINAEAVALASERNVVHVLNRQIARQLGA